KPTLTRRRLLAAGAATGAGLAAIAAGACGDDDDNGAATTQSGAAGTQAPASPTARTPDTAGALRAGVQADTGNLDPLSVGGASNTPNMVHFIGPVTRDPKTNEAKGYATDWRWTENNAVLLLTVKPGIKFHNGEVLNAESVKFTLDRA